jgi:glycosyltransferase involved in cell wall biosynthesis
MPIDLLAARPPLFFYAPLKSPDDPVPSGDRAVARLLMSGLRSAGFDPRVASTFRAFSRDGGDQGEILDRGRREAERLVEAVANLPCERRPRLWFTYHSYYKAPDLLGPTVSRALDIPYVLAEASHAEKRWNGPYARLHEASAVAARAADLHLVLNRRDGPGLAALRGGEAGLVHLPPFVAGTATAAPAPLSSTGPLRLVAVAMMRPPDKLQSYRLLAEALTEVDADWSLAICGDGTARTLVEAAFAPWPERVRFHGLVTDPDRLDDLYRSADLLVWPGFNEAFGMSYLEAARHGRPALAMRYGGVCEVVEHGVSGLLVDAGDCTGFAEGLSRLAGDRALLRRLGESARARATGRHGFEEAVGRLSAALRPLLPAGTVSCAS